MTSTPRTFVDRLYALTGSPLLFGLLSGLGVFYFLFFFGAYGIDQGTSYSGHSHLQRSLWFGLSTGLWYWTFERFLTPRLALRTARNKFFYYLLLLFIGGQFTFLLFNFFWNGQEFNWSAYRQISLEYPLMLLVPWFFHFALSKVPKPTAHSAPKPRLHFASSNGKDQLSIPADDFLFASASENYITIGYAQKDQFHTHVLRKTLKELEEELSSFTFIQRCHRSHLVHAGKSSSIRQSSGKITLHFGEHQVPVSKTYSHLFTVS